MNRLSVRGKCEKIARRGKGKGKFFTLSPNREPVHRLTKISIYALTDLGGLSNLIGSLSRTIQQ